MDYQSGLRGFRPSGVKPPGSIEMSCATTSSTSPKASEACLRRRRGDGFGNVPFSVLGILHWDILQLYRSILDAFAPPAELTGLPAWASTLGDWTTACWTMTANCWGTR